MRIQYHFNWGVQGDKPVYSGIIQEVCCRILISKSLNNMKRKTLKPNVKAAIVVSLVSLFSLFSWRDIWIYHEYKKGNTRTVTSECVSISFDQTNEPRRYSPFTIYSLHLNCGTAVAVYKDTADTIFPSKHVAEQKQALEQLFVSNRPITITYVAEPTVVNDTYALVYAFSDQGEVLIDASLGISYYAERVKKTIIVNCILYSVSILLLSMPLIPYLYRKWKHRQNRICKKRKKYNRK